MSPTPPTQPGAVGAPSIHMGMVEGDHACIRCSYNLKGLSTSASCPECGTPVADSLRGALLRYAAREYVEDLRKGLTLVLNAILLGIVFNIVSAVGLAIVAATNPQLASTITFIVQWGGVAIAALSLWGYWLVSQPDPQFGVQETATARSVLRWAAVAGGVIALSTPVVGLVASPAIEILVGILSLVAFAVQFFAMMMHARWLASRVPDAHIVKRAKVYMWLLPVLATVGVLVIIGPLVALVMYWNLLDRLRKHVRSILTSGVPASLPKMMG